MLRGEADTSSISKSFYSGRTSEITSYSSFPVETLNVQDLSLHILDIVENSIRADADRVDIVITEDVAQDLLTIFISDNGRGMDEETVQRVLDPFTTTRTTRRVGLGLSLLAESARQSGGDITVESAPGQGTTVSARFQHGHIDRRPLGDMINTLVTLVIGNIRVDFEYTHRVRDGEFRFRTTDLKEQLDDVPLNHPDVVKIIREYLREGFEEIGVTFF